MSLRIKKQPQFPQTLYVVKEDDGDGPFFVCWDNVERAAEIGETVVVATYVLQSTGNVTAKVVITTD